MTALTKCVVPMVTLAMESCGLMEGWVVESWVNMAVMAVMMPSEGLGVVEVLVCARMPFEAEEEAERKGSRITPSVLVPPTSTPMRRRRTGGWEDVMLLKTMSAVCWSGDVCWKFTLGERLGDERKGRSSEVQMGVVRVGINVGV